MFLVPGFSNTSALCDFELFLLSHLLRLCSSILEPVLAGSLSAVSSLRSCGYLRRREAGSIWFAKPTGASRYCSALDELGTESPAHRLVPWSGEGELKSRSSLQNLRDRERLSCSLHILRGGPGGRKLPVAAVARDNVDMILRGEPVGPGPGPGAVALVLLLPLADVLAAAVGAAAAVAVAAVDDFDGRCRGKDNVRLESPWGSW